MMLMIIMMMLMMIMTMINMVIKAKSQQTIPTLIICFRTFLGLHESYKYFVYFIFSQALLSLTIFCSLIIFVIFLFFRLRKAT